MCDGSFSILTNMSMTIQSMKPQCDLKSYVNWIRTSVL